MIRWRIALVALFWASAATSATGVTAPQGAAPAPAPATALTAQDLDSWLDGMMPYALNSSDIAGAVVVVVKDGQILTERGFGFSDVARRLPMDPRATLIRPGSVSKLFTWTAVMQLVEQGRLDLDADVNRYLDFRIPALAGKPITVRQLMCHTTGLEESLKDLGGRSPPRSLGDYLRAHVPERIYPAGEVPAYSNYASALAGYIVARLTGQSFETYVERYILTPLGMTHSTFRQPLPPGLAAALSKGYQTAAGPAQYFEYIGPYPAGSLSSTADDMARFMVAHLRGGLYGDARILQPQTADQMHSIQPRIYPALNGMALGFYETSRNGHKILAHNGGTQFFHSDLHLFMDDDVGIFICLNSAGVGDAASRLHDAFFHGFADRYFPAAAATAGTGETRVTAATAIKHANLMAGAWESSRRSATTFMSITGLLSPMMITANPDGTISIPIPSHGDMTWNEVEPFVWQEVGGQEKMQALVIKGQPAMVGFGMAPPAAFLPVPAYRSPTWLLPAVGAALLVLLINCLAWPVTRRVRFASLASVGAFACLLGTIVYMSGDISRLSSAGDGWIICTQIAILVAIPVSMLLGAFDAIQIWRSRAGWFRRVWCAAVLASFGVLLWVGVAFHLMNLDTQY